VSKFIVDILVAGVKDPMVMLMVVGAFSMALLVWGIAYIQVQSVRSFWWTTFFILVVYFFMFIGVHAKNKAQSIIEQKQDLILVDSKATSGTDADYLLLGTSINYVFLYNHQTKNTLILSLESVNSLTPKRTLRLTTLPVLIKAE
jgi:uncharacterized membrane protein